MERKTNRENPSCCRICLAFSLSVRLSMHSLPCVNSPRAITASLRLFTKRQSGHHASLLKLSSALLPSWALTLHAASSPNTADRGGEKSNTTSFFSEQHRIGMIVYASTRLPLGGENTTIAGDSSGRENFPR